LLSVKARQGAPTYEQTVPPTRRKAPASGVEFCSGMKNRPGFGRRVMIALEDCIALCGLSEEEVLAIAEHEHVPEIVACALGEYLLHQEHGPVRIRDMIIDDVRAAQARGDRERVRTLLHVLHQFLKTHPDAQPLRHAERQAS
jgi:hypothetical protein